MQKKQKPYEKTREKIYRAQLWTISTGGGTAATAFFHLWGKLSPKIAQGAKNALEWLKTAIISPTSEVYLNAIMLYKFFSFISDNFQSQVMQLLKHFSSSKVFLMKTFEAKISYFKNFEIILKNKCKFEIPFELPLNAKILPLSMTGLPTPSFPSLSGGCSGACSDP